MAFGETARLQQHQFLESFEEVVLFADALTPPQQVGRGGIGAGCTPDAEINPSRIERLQHLEAFGHRQRRMIWQHHAARPDVHVSSYSRDLSNHDLRCGARNRGQIVMFGHPIARESELVGQLRQIERISQRLRAGRAGRYW